jgi:tetratricopeptide (TPR) repeat protein
MKPLGTITMYYPFIDEKSKTIIETIMKESSSYYDFVIRLSDKVYESDVPETLAYLAAVHAWRLSASSAIEKISKKYSSTPIIRAWTSPMRKLPYEQMSAELEDIIHDVEEDWILAELLFLKCWYGKYIQPFLEVERNIDQAEAHLKKHPNLECFSSTIYIRKLEWEISGGSLDKANEYYDEVMRIAKKYDDQYSIYLLISTYTGWSRTYDAQKALKLQEEAYKLAKSFEAPQKIAEAMADIGRICETLGEYDLAIQSYHDSLETFGSSEMEKYREPGDTPAFCLSRVYCELGDGKSALEWIDTAYDLAGSSAFDTPYMISQRGEALVMLGRFEEAASHLDQCEKISLKSGRQAFLAVNGLTTGYLELAQGDPLTAIQTLEPCLDFVLNRPLSIYINRILIALTKAEIAANASGLTEISDKWISRLEQNAREKNLPGILMLHALLKADFLSIQGLRESAVTTLEEALKIDDSPSLKTLIERIQTKLSELEENGE